MKTYKMHYETSELITYTHECEITAKSEDEAKRILFRYYDPKTTMDEKRNMPVENEDTVGENNYDSLTDDVVIMINEYNRDGNPNCVCLNGTSEVEPEKDLFEHYNELPNHVRILVEHHCTQLNHNKCYDQLRSMVKDLKSVGYEFMYGLDLEPYNLRKIR